TSSSMTVGNQHLKNFTIDGDNKKLWGGIMVRGRSGILIEGLTVRDTYFTGIWLMDVKNYRITNINFSNCAYISSSYGTGALHVDEIDGVEVDDVTDVSGVGYGIRAMGVSQGRIYNTMFHHNKLTSGTQI